MDDDPRYDKPKKVSTVVKATEEVLSADEHKYLAQEHLAGDVSIRSRSREGSWMGKVTLNIPQKNLGKGGGHRRQTMHPV